MDLRILQNKREELQQALRDTAIQLEQIRGALSVVNQLIVEVEGNGIDIQAASADKREDRDPVE